MSNDQNPLHQHWSKESELLRSGDPVWDAAVAAIGRLRLEGRELIGENKRLQSEVERLQIELDAAYAEMHKHAPWQSVVFDHDVWRRVVRWGKDRELVK